MIAHTELPTGHCNQKSHCGMHSFGDKLQENMAETLLLALHQQQAHQIASLPTHGFYFLENRVATTKYDIITPMSSKKSVHWWEESWPAPSRYTWCPKFSRALMLLFGHSKGFTKAQILVFAKLWRSKKKVFFVPRDATQGGCTWPSLSCLRNVELTQQQQGR